MNVPESLIMELCNCQRTIGQLEERYTWLSAALEQSQGRWVERHALRLEICQSDLHLARERTAKLMREMHVE